MILFCLQVFALLGWVISAICCLSVVYGLYGVSNGKSVSAEVSALYSAVNRDVWALGLAWVIFACITGYGGMIFEKLWQFATTLLTDTCILVRPFCLTFYII